MKTAIRRTTLCAIFLAFAVLSPLAYAQKTPALQGTSVADPAVPVLVTPAPAGSGFFVLNQDFSLLQHSTVDTSQNQSCNGPGIFSRTNPAPRTLVTDLYNAYFTGPDGSGANTAIDALTPEVSCTPVQAFDYTGGLSQQSVSSNDPQHALFYTVSAYNDGMNNDQLIVLQNLNNATVSQTNNFTEVNEASLDLGGYYTSINSDTRSDFGLTAITELKTDSSPGNLWVYYPQTKFPYKILGPGGVPLPAVTSFIIPSQTDGGGSLLVLVNQDGLTASNQNAPPQDTTPITIIDLGQLRPLLDAAPPHGTITLPFVTQIKATTTFYAMLGGAYNPLDHRVYVMVAGGTSTTNVVENILSYDTLNPAAPGEVVVADVSNVTLSEGYPQLALNAASGTMQILPPGSGTVYSVGITGTGNTAVPVPGSTFPDTNFTPTYIAANPLQGETYIASSSGQVDVLTRPTTLQGGLTLTLTGPDLGYTSQEYQVKPLALWPVYDDSLATAKLTITVTPVGGTPVTLATGHVADVGYPGSSFYTYTFPAAGQYTIVATADASALYPAVTSPPLNVFVGNTGVYPTAVSLSVPATAPSSNGEASLNATVTLTGTTYGPTGQVYVQDQTGAEVGNVQLPKGVISNPVTVPIVIGDGTQTLTAVYSGDEQNQSSTSAPQTITVGTVTKVTPTFTVTVPSTAKTGASVMGNVKFTSSSTTAPTGTVTIYATLAGSTTANQIATTTAAQAFASGGASFSFTAPAAGSYTVFAGYGGDTNYNNAVSPSVAITVGGSTQQTSIGLVAPPTATAGTAFNVVVSFGVTGAYTTAPTGNIILTASSANAAPITLGMITPAQGMAPGGGNISATLPNAGSYTLNANYAGDSLYAPSSNTAPITVNGAAAATTTLGVSAPANVVPGASFITTVTLKTTGSSTAAITGNVTLMATGTGGTVNSYSLGTMPASKALQSGGVQFTGSIPVAGTYSLAAAYAGDTNYAASSGSVVVTVALATTTVGLSAGANQAPGVAFPLTVRLTPQSGATGTPTGNVVVTATMGTTKTTLVTLTAAQALASGGYQASVTLPSAGTFTVTAAYAGDADFSGSSASLVVTATTAATLSLSTNPASVAIGTSFQVCATVNSALPSAPTGTFTVSGVNPLGQAISFPPLTVTLSPGGSFGCENAMTLTQAGKYTFTATYAGDSSYPALNATLSVDIEAPVTSLTLAGAGTAVALAPYKVVTTLISTGTLPQGMITITATPKNSTTAAVTTTIDAATAGTGTTSFFTFPSADTYTVAASYPGGGGVPALTSTPLTVVVAAALPTSFTLTLDPGAKGTSDEPLGNNPGGNTAGMTLTTTGAGPGPVTLSVTGQANGTFVFRDAATMKLITSATPTAAGTKILLELDGKTAAATAAISIMSLRRHSLPLSLAGGFIGFALYRARKLKGAQLRGLNLFFTVLLVICSAAVLAGCMEMASTVVVTATPVTPSTAAPPQSVIIHVHTGG